MWRVGNISLQVSLGWQLNDFSENSLTSQRREEAWSGAHIMNL